MCCKIFCCAFISISIVICAIAVGIYFFLRPIDSYSELEKCPYCYGKELCPTFETKELSATFLSRLNILNDKNIFFGEYNNIDVIIKKLASTEELINFDNDVCHENKLHNGCNLGFIDDKQNYTQKILEHMDSKNTEFKSFKVCSAEAAEVLLDYFLKMNTFDIDKDAYLMNIWTTLKINVEPLMSKLLEGNWPIPKYYGACGRMAVMEHCGSTLLDKMDSPWADRAYLALQLLDGAKNFTFDHRHLRFYLTDISPDNIAVDPGLRLTFIDLENLVVFYQKTHTEKIHKSENIHDPNGFAYVEQDLCSHSVSDHNYYAICSLLLSKDSPYPMVKNGLLHSPPVQVAHKYPQLFALIEDCSHPKEKNSDRFKSGQQIMDLLNEILSEDERMQNTTVID